MRILRTLLLTPALVVVATMPASPQSQAGASIASDVPPVAVIVHPDVAQDTLTRDELLDYFTADRQEWPDGTRVVIKEMKTRGSVRKAFYEFIGQRPSRLKSIWLRNLLSGEGERPESLDSPEAMVTCVADTPGAIGFVHADSVDERVRTLILISAE